MADPVKIEEDGTPTTGFANSTGGSGSNSTGGGDYAGPADPSDPGDGAVTPPGATTGAGGGYADSTNSPNDNGQGKVTDPGPVTTGPGGGVPADEPDGAVTPPTATTDQPPADPNTNNYVPPANNPYGGQGFGYDFMGAGTSGGAAGQIDPTTGQEFEATTREVQDEELVSHQLNQLLASDSQYIQEAKRQGIAAANARGGLGGTMQSFAAVTAAIRSGLPIATADAQAFRDAAAQNMNALNQFGLANKQAAVQIATANLDAQTRVQTTAMVNASNQAIAKLNSMTQLENTKLNGMIQGRLADQQFRINQTLNRERHAYNMETTSLQGEYNLAGIQLQQEVQREANYINSMLGGFDQYISRIDSLNNIEMDDNARARAQEQIWNDYQSYTNLMNVLFPGVPPLVFGQEDTVPGNTGTGGN